MHCSLLSYEEWTPWWVSHARSTPHVRGGSNTFRLPNKFPLNERRTSKIWAPYPSTTRDKRIIKIFLKLQNYPIHKIYFTALLYKYEYHIWYQHEIHFSKRKMYSTIKISLKRTNKIIIKLQNYFIHNILCHSFI